MSAARPRRLSQPLQAFREVFRNPDLRRLELGWGCFYVGEWAYVVALAVFAYAAGGAWAVGLVGLIRMLPAAVAVPFGSLLADRYRRERVILLVDLGRALVVAASAAAVFADAPAGVVYGLATVGALTAAPFRPAQWALLPVLARTPRELVAANAASSTIESVAILAGPALAGLLLAAASAGWVFAAGAAVFAWAALLVGRIETKADTERGRWTAQEGVVGEALAGFRSFASERDPRLLISLFGAQTLVRGLLNVLIVVSALELLDMGESGVGFLNSAVGVGGLVGGLAALGLVGRRRLGHPVGVGLVLWGLPIALIGVWPEAAGALVFLAAVGAGNSVLDVAGLTLIQRIVADEVLARVFGVLETLATAMVGLGAILAPLLIAGLGMRATLIATGAILPALALLFWRRFGEIDDTAAAPGPELALLRSVPLFAPLPAATLEHLASSLIALSFPAGAHVMRQGEPGDRFYVVAGGELDVRADGRRLSPLGPGDSFGEIALLRDVPRTATVTARTEVRLHALERDEFVAAVSGHPQSAETAEAVIATRLGSLRARVASA